MSVATVGGVDEQAVDDVAAATGFSGVVRVDRDGEPVVAKAYRSPHCQNDVSALPP